MTKSRRDRFPLLAMLGLCLPLFARFEGDEQGEGGGGGESSQADESGQTETSTSEAPEAPATNETEGETVQTGSEGTQEAAEPASEAGEEGADTGGQPAAPTLQDILARLGAATANAPAKPAPGATAATPAPKGEADPEATKAALALLDMTEEDLADIEAQMPVAGKKVAAALKKINEQAALLEALKGDYDQRQEQSQRQAVIAKHQSIDAAIKDTPGAAERYGKVGSISEAQLAERNATYDLADKVFCSMRDSGKPITEKEAWTWADTLRQGKTIEQPAAIRVVRSEVNARNRQMTVPGGTGRAPAKTDDRKAAAAFFDQGLKQLTGQG